MSNSLEETYRQIAALKQDLYRQIRESGGDRVDDFEMQTIEGPRRLSELFDGRDELLVIHNMGRRCVYCTTWADGLNGLLPHLENRSAVVLVSPDAPEVQRDFADSRGWKFRMVSDPGSFTTALGFLTDDGWMPGVSVLRRESDGTIVRVGSTFFGPMDDFCPVFPLMEMFPQGVADWEPQYEYAKGSV